MPGLARQELDRLLALKDRDGGRFVSDEALSRARASEERAQAQLRSARFEADVRDHELAAAVPVWRCPRRGGRGRRYRSDWTFARRWRGPFWR